MAQQTKGSRSSSGSRSKTRASSPKGRAAASSGSSGSRSQNASAAQRKTRSRSSSARSRSTSNSRGSSAKPTSSETDSSNARSVGHTVAAAASKAKTPLIAGGAALAGAAGGILIKNRTSASKGPMTKLRRMSLPKPNGKLNLSKVDLKAVKSTAERISSLGQQAADIAAAAEKTRKKNN